MLGAVRPRALEQAPALLEGGEDQVSDPLPLSGRS